MPAGDFVHRLRSWKSKWADNYPHGQPYEVPSPEPEEADQHWGGNRGFDFQLPPFICSRYVDQRPETNIYYPDLFLTQALTVYYAGMVSLAHHTTDDPSLDPNA